MAGEWPQADIRPCRRERCKGYEEALRDYGIALNPALIVERRSFLR
jgi:hypothetical protein